VEGLESLEALGNVGVIPVVIFLTQLIKKRFGNGFKYKSDAIALVLSFILCIGWTFYYMTPEAFNTLAASMFLAKFRWGIDQLVIGFATWLAASKLYDLGHGNKKRENKVIEEKKVLEEKIVVLENGQGGNNEKPVEETDLSSRLREVLEEGN
jgi:hypothetical protein